MENAFSLALTTAEGWFALGSLDISATKDPSSTFINNGQPSQTLSYKLEFKGELSFDDPAVLPYDALIHGGTFETRHPMARIVLAKAHLYGIFRPLKLTSIDIRVEVEGVKDLAITNKFGPQDPANPFYPFGLEPEAGDSLIIGSKEIFQKRVKNAELHILWKGLPKSAQNQLDRLFFREISDSLGFFDITRDFVLNTLKIPLVHVEFLISGTWKGRDQNSFLFEFDDLFNSDADSYYKAETLKNFYAEISDEIKFAGLDEQEALTRIFVFYFYYLLLTMGRSEKISLVIPFESGDVIPADFVQTQNFNARERNGYFRLLLQQNFGHELYRKLAIEDLIDKANQSDGNRTENISTPYSPEIDTISIDYRAEASTTEDNAGIAFFHLLPFGGSPKICL